MVIESDVVTEEIIDLRSIHQFHDSTLPQLRTRPCAIRLENKPWVGTPLCKNLVDTIEWRDTLLTHYINLTPYHTKMNSTYLLGCTLLPLVMWLNLIMSPTNLAVLGIIYKLHQEFGRFSNPLRNISMHWLLNHGITFSKISGNLEHG